jgi:hypothetical protein
VSTAEPAAGPAVGVRWLTAFIDREPRSFSAATEFWLAVTGSTLSEPRGHDGEFATLVPHDGDAYLRVQRIRDGEGGSHLDVHVDDISGSARRATELGAMVEGSSDDVIVMRSPAGLPFCFVDHGGESRPPAPPFEPGRPVAIVDQLCIDIPPAAFEGECRFWAELTGWKSFSGGSPKFWRVEPPPSMPLGLLLQRQDEPGPSGRATAHLDLACTDADAMVRAHEGRGARLVGRFDHWITMADPAGVAYCLTRRTPGARPSP